MAKKKVSKKAVAKKKLNSYSVPVTVTYSGHVDVFARDKTEALDKAREKYTGIDSLEYPCIDVDFEEDEQNVEDNDTDEDLV